VPPMEVATRPLASSARLAPSSGPSPWPQMATISPGDTPAPSYDAVLVTAVTTGCGTLIALCACGITSRVIEYFGNVILRPLEDTEMSEDWRTIALRLLWLYCQTWAIPAGVKLARLMASARSLAVLF